MQFERVEIIRFEGHVSRNPFARPGARSLEPGAWSPTYNEVNDVTIRLTTSPFTWTFSFSFTLPM